MKLKIGYLYGDIMNTYGDGGNITALTKRAEWRGIDVEVVNISIGDPMDEKTADIFFFGGGQDSGQVEVAQDLQKKGKILKELVEKGVPLLAICGGYQLLGEYYQPHVGPNIVGIDLFPTYTKASHDRMIGNLVVQESDIKLQDTVDHTLVGFENHSGKTYLKAGAQPLGKVISGFGNNGENRTEGCVYKNAIGCYMHGSLLPKNPVLTDWLIKTALEVKYAKNVNLEPLDDTFETNAHDNTISRFS